MMFLSTLNLFLVVCARPAAPLPRVSGKFMKALPDKLGTSHTPVHPMLFATLFRDWGDPGQLLHIRGGVITIPISGEPARVRLYFEEPFRIVMMRWFSLAIWVLFGLVLAAGFAQFRLPYLSRKPILQQQFE